MQQKSIILELDEAKRELVECVNNVLQKHGLNCYLLKPIFADLFAEIQNTAQNELEHARRQYGAAQTAPNNTK